MLRGLTAVLLISVAAVACGDDDDSGGRDRAINVFAASALAGSFADIGAAFEEEFDDTSVLLNVAASSELMAQIDEGAPADVFASADEATMARLVDGVGTTSEPQVFATNVLQIMVEAGNPLGIATLDDLADPELLVVVAAPEVPIGRYTRQVLDAADVHVEPRSLEGSVRGVASKVLLGEADAGIVYATDVVAAGDRAAGVEIPVELNVVARFPVAVSTAAADPATAQAFVDFVLSDTGQAILASYGFTAP